MDALVLDSPCFLQLERLPPSFSGKTLLTTPGVVSEILSDEGKIRFSQAKGVIVSKPSEEFLENANAIAKSAGDSRLSETDRSLLALALERNAALVTDDYSLQNACKLAKIAFLPVTQAGISKARKFSYKCSGCRKEFWKPGTCPECGNEIKGGFSREG